MQNLMNYTDFEGPGNIFSLPWFQDDAIKNLRTAV